MKQLPHRRIALEFALSSTEAVLATGTATKDHPYDARITPKPELRKRSGELDPDDPRFIGYDIIGGDSTQTVIEHTCNVNYTLSVSGQFYSCCPTSTNVCSFATNCIGESYELFDGGITSRCATVCRTGAVYSATNDKSPLTHIGCGVDGYTALRNRNTDLLNGWQPSPFTPWPTVGFTATGIGDATDATPTPGEPLVYTDNEAVWGPGVEYEATFHFTKVTGGIVGGVVLVGVIILWILGKRQRNRAKHTRVAELTSQPRPLPIGSLYAGLSNNFGMPGYSAMISPQQHELTPMPPAGPLPPREYPIPAHQIFRPQAQRAGYTHILSDQSQATIDHESFLASPPPYVETGDEFSSEETRGHETL